MDCGKFNKLKLSKKNTKSMKILAV